jgi:hypothetical protein
LLLVVVLLVSALPVLADEARKSCEELKAEVAVKLDAKGVRNYTLAIVKAEEVRDAKVVGSCDGGARKIIYEQK